METAPSTALEMAESDLLLEFLIVTLDAPAQFGEVDQILQSGVRGKSGEPAFGRLFLALGPLDQEPFFRSALAARKVTPRCANTHLRKPRRKVFGRAFSPC